MPSLWNQTTKEISIFIEAKPRAMCLKSENINLTFFASQTSSSEFSVLLWFVSWTTIFACIQDYRLLTFWCEIKMTIPKSVSFISKD